MNGEIVFNTYGNDKQKECARKWIDDMTTEIVFGGGKGGGKSYVGASLIFGDAFLYPKTNYFIARKNINDLRKTTVKSIHEVFGAWGITNSMFTYNGQDNFYQLSNGSTVYLLSAKYLPADPDYTRFGSYQMTRGWIEEAGEVEEEAKSSLMATIGRWKNDEYGLLGKMLMTCNPSKNFLYRAYYKPFRDGELEPHKAFIQALINDNKKIDSRYYESLVNSLNANQKERLIKGNWEYDDDPSALISYEAITDYFNPSHLEQDDSFKCITADIARKGKDNTIVRVWYGNVCVERRSMAVSLVTESADLISEIAKRHSVPRSKILVDEDGVGGGVVDILSCKGFVNNSKALNDENYENLKSQCSYIMAQMIEAREIGEVTSNVKVIELLTEEMEQVKQADMDVDGKRKIIKKDSVKQMIGRSPDEWDSVMMRAWFKIKYGDKRGKYVIL